VLTLTGSPRSREHEVIPVWFAGGVNPRPRLFVLVAIGLVGGLLSGAFGVGGGIVMVPMLTVFARVDQRRASAISLLAILPTSIAGSITYLVHGEVDIVAGVFIAIGAVVGSIIGSALLRRISLTLLRWLFVALLVVVAVRMIFVSPERADPYAFSPALAFGYVALGLFMGVASGLLGIGGGAIAVPALVALFGFSDLIAKGTSLLVMIPTSLAGSITNARAELVELRSGLTVGIAAAAASVPGVFIALVLPPRLSTVLFAVLLLAVAVQLAVRALRRS
jgi:uncharacterized protein